MTWHQISTFFITILQVPFIILNIGIAMFYHHSSCMDSSHGMSFFILRPWLIGVSVIDVLLLLGMVIVNYFRAKAKMSLHKMLEYGNTLSELALGKALIWGLAELGMLYSGILTYCWIGMVAYCTLVMIMHIFMFILYLWYHR